MGTLDRDYARSRFAGMASASCSFVVRHEAPAPIHIFIFLDMPVFLELEITRFPSGCHCSKADVQKAGNCLVPNSL
jgi:hypothetical protein